MDPFLSQFSRCLISVVQSFCRCEFCLSPSISGLYCAGPDSVVDYDSVAFILSYKTSDVEALLKSHVTGVNQFRLQKNVDGSISRSKIFG